uniref:Uncharacterized protein n=1 Tax=Arundo donax TaxID=35708 RepID=A0A0A9CBD9_ARUDO
MESWTSIRDSKFIITNEGSSN